MPTNTYDFETKTYSSDGRSIIKIDSHMNVSHLNLRLDISDYDTAGAGSALREGWATNLIDTIKVGQGTRYPIVMDGKELVYGGTLLTKAPVNFVKITDASATGKTARVHMPLPINIPVGLYPNLEVVVEWGTDAAIGANQTVVAAALNGSVSYTDDPVPPYKMVTQTHHTNVSSGTQRFDVDPEGRLSKIMLIVRNNASPNALADNVDTVSLRIEGVEIFETEFEDMRSEWMRYAPALGLDTDYGYDTGFGIIELADDLPAIGTNSHLFVEVGATASQLVAMFLYEPDDRLPAAPTLTPAIAGQQQVARKIVGGARGRNVAIAGYNLVRPGRGRDRRARFQGRRVGG